MATTSQDDDFALFRQIFSATDYIMGSGGDDVFALGKGDDVYLDTGGQDRVLGGPGRDFLTVGNQTNGPFDDTVLGGTGDDILACLSGNGGLYGGAGYDILIAGTQDDRARGGAGQDSFVFGIEHGRHVVVDFDTATDTLVILDAVTALGDLTITQHGGSAEISYGSFTLVLRNVDAGQLGLGNISFGATAFAQAAENTYLAGFVYDV